MRVAILLAVMLLTLAPSAAHADKGVAREQYRRALQHFNLREYQDALAGFKEAYRNYEDPSFLFNIAQCERLLNHKQDAIQAYRTYLLNAPNAANRDEVRALVDRLTDELQKERETEKIPPQGVLKPVASDAESKPVVTAPPAAEPTRDRPPLYKRWWLWTAVGVVAVGAGLGLGLGLGLPHGTTPAATASTTLGTSHPF